MEKKHLLKLRTLSRASSGSLSELHCYTSNGCFLARLPCNVILTFRKCHLFGQVKTVLLQRPVGLMRPNLSRLGFSVTWRDSGRSQTASSARDKKTVSFSKLPIASKHKQNGTSPPRSQIMSVGRVNTNARRCKVR